MSTINWPEAIEKFDSILARGLCAGVGEPDGQMCIEAAITQALGLPFGDDPECVASAVREYKIALNDSAHWHSPESRARGLRALGIAQIGSAGVVDDDEFTKRLAEKTIRVLIPALFREVLAHDEACMKAAAECEAMGSSKTAYAAYYAASAANAYAAYYAAPAAYYAAPSADAANYAASVADAAAYAAYAAAGEKYLRMSARLALEVLRELGSPGCAYVTEEA